MRKPSEVTLPCRNTMFTIVGSQFGLPRSTVDVVTTVPVIDISRFLRGEHDAELPQIVDEALRTSGFLLVTGHGVPTSVPVELRRRLLGFFHDSAETKYEVVSSGNARGWRPPASVANAKSYGVDTAHDLHETLSFGRERMPDDDPDRWYPPNHWPAAPHEMHDVVTSYLESMHVLAEALMRLCAEALGIDVELFDNWRDDSIGTFAVNWYPSYRHTGDALDEQYRIGPHTDFGALTLLDREPAIRGLQIQTLDDEWIDAPYVPGALTVNIGDLMARWTGDRWRSTRHRVLAPSPDAPDEEIVSLVFFYDVDPKTIVAPLPGAAAGPSVYEPVLAGDYIAAKIAAISVG